MQQQHQVQQQAQAAAVAQQTQSSASPGHTPATHHQHHHLTSNHQVTAALLNGAHHQNASSVNMVQASPGVPAQFLFNGSNHLNGLGSGSGIGPGVTSINTPAGQFISSAALAQAGLVDF